MSNINKRTLSCKYESLDYDLIENVIYLEHQHKSRLSKFINRDLQWWIAIFLIGFAAALSGFLAGFSVKFFTQLKFSQIIRLAEDNCPAETQNSTTTGHNHLALLGCLFPSYLTWLGWNATFCLIGSLMVTYIAPVAAGSGIPVVKCYLNGVKIPEVVRFKTYAVKLLGVISSVIGGLAAGKEGPFIHCGAAIGAGLSQGKSTTFKFDTKLFKSFRNDRDKRDFVSAGASAGVAAAFGAPIGGVLFALEEGASFWNQSLTWRIFFCSMMTSFVMNLFNSALNNDGILAFHSLVNFGLVEELDYFWFEIPVYIGIAVVGGIIGASFCYFNLVITQFRRQYVNTKFLKVLEVVLIATLTATVGLALIIFASECRKLPESGFESEISEQSSAHGNALHQKSIWNMSYLGIFHKSSPYKSADEVKRAMSGHVLQSVCPPGYYSAMSSLWLKTSEGVSSTFMVLQDDIWSIRTLSLFLMAYYLLAVVTYGISVSAGVFIPSLLIGATGGRLIGLILHHYLGPLAWLEQPNKFAIIGAASVLGGVVRMTISLTVIIIEATGCISFGMPIMICLMISKWVADSFIEGLYDLAIHLANVPFLDWEPPVRSYSIYASDVMSPNVKVLRTTETVSNLITMLKSTTHNGFPVVDVDGEDCPEDQRRVSDETLTDNSMNTGIFLTPLESPSTSTARVQFNRQASTSSFQSLIKDSMDEPNQDTLIGSFQRCTVTPKRESKGRFRGIILRSQLLVMLQLKMFNENEHSYESINLKIFQSSYPRYPKLDKVMQDITEEMLSNHVDLRSIMNPTAYTVSYSASFPRIYKLFRSLGLRHLVVTDDRNQVVGMITRKDLARYVGERDNTGRLKFHELTYSS